MISPEFFSDWPTAKVSECMAEAQKELNRRGVSLSTVLNVGQCTCEQLAYLKLAVVAEQNRRHHAAFDVSRN